MTTAGDADAIVGAMPSPGWTCWPAGRSNLSLAHLAVRGLPGSGSGAELLARAGLDADHIAAAARRLLDPASASPGLRQSSRRDPA